MYECVFNGSHMSVKYCCLCLCRETSNYHRCGRTDKGVSAFGQVSSLGTLDTCCGESVVGCGMLSLDTTYAHIYTPRGGRGGGIFESLCLCSHLSRFCSDDTFWTAFETKHGMVMHHDELDSGCHAKELICCLQDQGHSGGSYNQTITVSAVSSAVVILLLSYFVSWAVITLFHVILWNMR